MLMRWGYLKPVLLFFKFFFVFRFLIFKYGHGQVAIADENVDSQYRVESAQYGHKHHLFPAKQFCAEFPHYFGIAEAIKYCSKIRMCTMRPYCALIGHRQTGATFYMCATQIDCRFFFFFNKINFLVDFVFANRRLLCFFFHFVNQTRPHNLEWIWATNLIQRRRKYIRAHTHSRKCVYTFVYTTHNGGWVYVFVIFGCTFDA